MGLFDAIAREATYVTGIGRSLIRLRHVKPDSPVTIVDIVDGFAQRTPDAIAIVQEDRAIGYRALCDAADRYAHWANAQGIGRGDVVALLMENRPEYLFAWLGLLKVGATIALVNTNLRGQALAHSIAIVGARHVVLGAELAENFVEA
ncbi:MAG TPA: AMP-binding protein, partial [Rhizomicrobium sp.]|nr:AMP-binding protein [Rhizomicrobium sp.]